jgi:hypothetical protein
MQRKIISSSNTGKTLWISIKLDDEVIKKIQEIILEIDKNSMGLEEYDDKVGKYLPSSEIVNRNYRFFNDEESLYLFFFQDYVALILRKESKYFKKLKKLFFDNFEFVDTIPLDIKKKHLKKI